MSSTMSTETRAYLRERRRQQRIERASETAAATETQIARLAQAAFKDHVLTAEGPHWRCGRPDTGVYGFWLYAPAGAVMVWGDIGAFMLRHGSQDSLGWLRLDGLGQPIDPRQHYFIQDSRSYVGNLMSFWRPEGKGYCCCIDDAGRYRGDDLPGGRETDVAWPVPYIEARMARYVDAQRVGKP